MTDLWSNHQLAACQILEAWGIDPYEVMKDVGETGYLTRRRDAFGKTVIENESIVLDAHEWPKGFPLQEFLSHVERMR